MLLALLRWKCVIIVDERWSWRCRRWGDYGQRTQNRRRTNLKVRYSGEDTSNMTCIVSSSLLYDSWFRIADIESERKCKIIIPKSKSITDLRPKLSGHVKKVRGGAYEPCLVILNCNHFKLGYLLRRPIHLIRFTFISKIESQEPHVSGRDAIQ